MDRTYLDNERETIIRFDDSSDRAVVNTFNRAFQRKLERLLKSNPDDVYLIDDYKRDNNNGILVTLPKSWIKIRTPMKMTDEQRQARAERARAHGFNSTVQNTADLPDSDDVDD